MLPAKAFQQDRPRRLTRNGARICAHPAAHCADLRALIMRLLLLMSSQAQLARALDSKLVILDEGGAGK